MYYTALDHVLDIRCHRHLPNSSKNQPKPWDLRYSVCMSPKGCNGGDVGKGPPWVEAVLAAKTSLSLKSSISSEGSPGYGGKTAEVEELWREFFLNPTGWRDHRSDKPNPRFPDFKHRTHPHKALWLDSKWIPPWVEAKLVAAGWEYNFLSGGALCYAGKEAESEELWRELFLDPTEWRDHRSDKANPRFPDFKHKKHPEKALWLNSKWIPTWVNEKLVALPPGSIQSSAFPRNKQLSMYARTGQYEKTIELFQQMQRDGETTDRFTFVPVIQACSRLGLLEHGRRIHTLMQSGFEADLFVGTCLVDMYSKRGSIEEAEMVFKQMPTKDVVTFNTMIGGYVKCGEAKKALELFERMEDQGLDPNPVTYVGILNACANIAEIEGVRCVHEEIIRRGFESDIAVGTCLVDMYAKYGSIEEAERVFNKMPTRNVVTFNAMICGYVKCREGHKALVLFDKMKGQGLDLDSATFVGVLNACASIAAIEGGRRAHEEIIRRGYESDIVVGNCLVYLYTKCGSIKEAERVFDKMPTRDVVTWTAMLAGYVKCGSIEKAERLFTQMPTRNVVTFNAMIGGYVKCGEGQKALELFEQMQGRGLDPDPVTFVEALNACATVAAIEAGRCVHEEIIRRGYESDVAVGTCLVGMYAKCGSMEEAEIVFNKMPTRDVVTWTAMLAGYGIHGYTGRALETFKEMCKVVEVDSITFISLLSACSHGGLVAEGLEYFKSMSTVYNITPKVEHFACIVDILGRAGRLREAEDLIMSMPMDPNASVWMALLGACRAHVNVEVGQRCAERVLELEPDNAAAYILLSNIYVAADKFSRSARLNEERLDRGVMKIPARTWIEVNAQVHSFVVDDHLHPCIVEIRADLDRLFIKMSDSGYLAETKFLQCVNEEERESHLCHHAEKLAIAFGLLSTALGTPLLVQKNLSMCRDCHTATKFISKIVGRAITVSDANGFHQFQHGVCSCGD